MQSGILHLLLSHIVPTNVNRALSSENVSRQNNYYVCHRKFIFWHLFTFIAFSIKTAGSATDRPIAIWRKPHAASAKAEYTTNRQQPSPQTFQNGDVAAHGENSRSEFFHVKPEIEQTVDSLVVTAPTKPLTRFLDAVDGLSPQTQNDMGSTEDDIESEDLHSEHTSPKTVAVVTASCTGFVAVAGIAVAVFRSLPARLEKSDSDASNEDEPRIKPSLDQFSFDVADDTSKISQSFSGRLSGISDATEESHFRSSLYNEHLFRSPPPRIKQENWSDSELMRFDTYMEEIQHSDEFDDDFDPSITNNLAATQQNPIVAAHRMESSVFDHQLVGVPLNSNEEYRHSYSGSDSPRAASFYPKTGDDSTTESNPVLVNDAKWTSDAHIDVNRAAQKGRKRRVSLEGVSIVGNGANGSGGSHSPTSSRVVGGAPTTEDVELCSELDAEGSPVVDLERRHVLSTFTSEYEHSSSPFFRANRSATLPSKVIELDKHPNSTLHEGDAAPDVDSRETDGKSPYWHAIDIPGPYGLSPDSHI